MSQAHYKSAVTGELVPEDELLEVEVYRVQLDGHAHFKPERVGSAYVEQSLTGVSGYTGIELLTVARDLVLVYREDLTYGRAYPRSYKHMDDSFWEMWQDVVDTVLEEQ